MWTYQRTDELYHHGILGMKWGIRRYQNKDGSLTSLGRRHQKEKGWSRDAKDASRLKRKGMHQMTNQELKRYNERRNLEENYKRLNPSKAKAITKGVLATIGTAATIASLADMGPKYQKIFNSGKGLVNKIVKRG